MLTLYFNGVLLLKRPLHWIKPVEWNIYLCNVNKIVSYRMTKVSMKMHFFYFNKTISRRYRSRFIYGMEEHYKHEDHQTINKCVPFSALKVCFCDKLGNLLTNGLHIKKHYLVILFWREIKCNSLIDGYFPN
jgi:hypothetical protein